MSQITFIGLGAMGMGMAQCLVKSGYDVVGFDISPTAREGFIAAGGRSASTASAAVQGSAVVFLMVVSAAQIDGLLFGGEESVAVALKPGAALAICATVPPDYPRDLQERLKSRKVEVVDCPVSGGTVRASSGTLKIFVSRLDAVLEGTLLRQSLDIMADELDLVPGGVGAGSKLKLINQQLAGIHIAAAAEVSALAMRLGLDLRRVLNAVTHSQSSSWMFEDRVPHMIDRDWTPKSALAIFVKDMDIVTSAASKVSLPMPMSAITQQIYALGATQGYTYEDDSGLVRVYLPQPELAQSKGTEQDIKESATDALLMTLLGVHTLAAAEALALADKIGLDKMIVYNGIKGAAGSSVAFKMMGSTVLKGTAGSLNLNTITAGLNHFITLCMSFRMPAFLSVIAAQTLSDKALSGTGHEFMISMFQQNPEVRG